MKPFSKGLLFLLSLTYLYAVAAPALSRFAQIYQSASVNTPYGWQDEGYVMGPALQVYKEGYWGFRCRENSPSQCYGSTQVFLDALTLKLFPESWLLKSAYRDTPSARWFFKGDFPEALRILRLTRLFYAFLLGLALTFFARKAQFSKVMSFALGFGIACFPIFAVSWQGLKNEYSSVVWLLLFQFAAFYSLFEPADRTSKTISRRFLLTLIVGVLSIGAKFSNIMPVVFFVPAYCLVMKFKGTSWKCLVRHVAVGGVFAAMLWGVSYPNIRISSTESVFFMGMLQVGKKEFNWANTLQEFYSIGFISLWPIYFLIVDWLATFKPKDWAREFLPWGYFVFVPLFWTLLTLKSAWMRPAYYFPPVVWSLGAALLLLSRLLTRRPVFLPQLFKIAFATCMLFTVVNAGNSDLRFTVKDWLRDWPAWDSKKHGTDAILNSPSARDFKWAIDLQQRPSLSRDGIPENSILYFDSLSESPARVSRAIAERWPKEKELVKILATCWGKIHPEPLLYSPAAEAWSQALGVFCTHWAPDETELSLRRTYPYENGTRNEAYAVISGTEFAKLNRDQPEVLTLKPNVLTLNSSHVKINPHVLRGAILGVDYWFSPLVLFQPSELTGEFKWERGFHSVDFEVDSNCKYQGSLTAEVITSRGKVARTVSLDVSTQTCAEYPWVCRLGLEQWWAKRYPLQVHLDAPVGAGERATLRITTDELVKARCRAAFQLIEFNGS